MFRDNLHNVLMDIYNMTTKLGFSAEYVGSISPAERGMYIKYYLREKEEEKKRNQKGQDGPMIGGPTGE